jgi:aromatase
VTTSAIQNVEHEISVHAPADRVYQLIADVASWPEMFPPTIHAESTWQGERSELIRIWATANGTGKTWTSVREHDPRGRSISFRQERPQPPLGDMGGVWIVEPVSAAECHVRLCHQYYALSDEPAELGWIARAVDHNSTAELQALKCRAELDGSEHQFSFEDAVEVDGSAEDVYEFLNEAQLWPERLPHVARVVLTEETPGLQVLEMDTRGADGSVHTTKSVRVCQPHASIVYKQIILPKLLTVHTGRWLITPVTAWKVTVTSRHAVRINADLIPEVLGTMMDLPGAQATIRAALGANSLATLRLAKAYAEESDRRRVAS